MDCEKIGALIYNLRLEKGLTQKQLADLMHISDKTVSKWERGMGCPDVSLLSELSNIFGVDTERILSGSLDSNEIDGGNIKKTKFYVCPNCANTTIMTGEADLSCCGRKLTALTAKLAQPPHHINVEEIEDDYYITFSHTMTKNHYLTFIAYVSYDRFLYVKLYPEQSSEVRFPKMQGGRFYFHCNQHGLWVSI